MPKSFLPFSQALRRLLARPELRDRFMETETAEEVREKLDVTPEMATELKRILLSLPDTEEAADPVSGDELEDKAVASAMESVSSAEDFLDRSFAQLRTGARVLMFMSVTMFLIGVGFLVIAAIRSFTHPDSAQTTGVIAGVGVVQIVFLFYRNPLRDIGRSVSNAQQAKMVVMSYMLGVSLVAKSLKGTDTEKEQQALATLTKNALEQLEGFTEAKGGSKDADALRQAADAAAAQG